MTGPPDEGGGSTVGLQPSGTLLASEEDVVEVGWAPKFRGPTTSKQKIEPRFKA